MTTYHETNPRRRREEFREDRYSHRERQRRAEADKSRLRIFSYAWAWRAFKFSTIALLGAFGGLMLVMVVCAVWAICGGR